MTGVITTIIVGVDGSADARRALAWAVDAAEALGAREVAVHGVGLLEHQKGDPSGHHLEPALAGWTAELDRLPADRVARRLVPGDPATAVATVAADEGASLVVVGSRGEGARAGVLIGSTSLQLAERSAGPLVIVPAEQWSAPGPALR